MIYIYEFHCKTCNMNIRIETDEKKTKKPKCSKCGKILKDGHLSEEANKKFEKELEEELSKNVKKNNDRINKVNSRGNGKKKASLKK